MIARRQPLAVDLRETISAIRISGDVERIGDLAKNISKRALAIAGQFQPQKVVAGLQHMSELAMAQLKDVLDAYVQKNSKAALDVWQRDGQIDSLNTSLFRELLTHDGGSRNISFCRFSSWPRTSSASATTPPTLPRPSITSLPEKR